MNQQPITFPVLQAGMPTSEGTTLFAAGVAWLSIVGFPPVDPKPSLADQVLLTDQQSEPTP